MALEHFPGGGAAHDSTSDDDEVVRVARACTKQSSVVYDIFWELIFLGVDWY